MLRSDVARSSSACRSRPGWARSGMGAAHRGTRDLQRGLGADAEALSAPVDLNERRPVGVDHQVGPESADVPSADGLKRQRGAQHSVADPRVTPGCIPTGNPLVAPPPLQRLGGRAPAKTS
jgi:hypothetical protein